MRYRSVNIESRSAAKIIRVVLSFNINTQRACVGKYYRQTQFARFLSKVGFGSGIFIAASQARQVVENGWIGLVSGSPFRQENRERHFALASITPMGELFDESPLQFDVTFQLGQLGCWHLILGNVYHGSQTVTFMYKDVRIICM